MATQEIPAQEQKTQPKTEEPKKEKNPKCVAAGKQGAEARWNKQKQAQAEYEPIRITKEPERPIKIKEPQERPTVNIYKNYIPLCVLIGAVGIGIFMIYGRKTMQPEIQPKVQPEIQPEIKN